MSFQALLFPTFLLFLLVSASQGFQVAAFALSRRSRSLDLADLQLAKDDDSGTENVDPVTKSSWYVVEAFGKVFGSPNEEKNDDFLAKTDEPPRSMDETLARLAADNEREYFLSGQVDKWIYDEQCTFADPFVSFDGRDRFVENLANLGSFITEYSAKQLAYEQKDNVVITKFMVKLQLNLPWKPILAWPWGVICTVDPKTLLITRHEETWDIDALEGVKQIFRTPTTSIKK